VQQQDPLKITTFVTSPVCHFSKISLDDGQSSDAAEAGNHPAKEGQTGIAQHFKIKKIPLIARYASPHRPFCYPKEYVYG
jgi:hypothetical protein